MDHVKTAQHQCWPWQADLASASSSAGCTTIFAMLSSCGCRECLTSTSSISVMSSAAPRSRAAFAFASCAAAVLRSLLATDLFPARASNAQLPMPATPMYAIQQERHCFLTAGMTEETCSIGSGITVRLLLTCPEVFSDLLCVQKAQRRPLALVRSAQGELHLVKGDHHILDTIVAHTCMRITLSQARMLPQVTRSS